ncbi:MAG: small multi-drug export protein [Kiritimatiellae bacterium]|nr:small multi-drug export protein [Kiritimatiellia bacterium]
MGLLSAIAFLVFFTLLPGLEARASVPLAFFHRDIRAALGLPLALGICFVCNLLVGLATYWIMGPVVQVLRRWAWFDVKVWPSFERTRQKLHPHVEKYGEMGLALFIGVPLPGTGAYTGAFGAFLMGMDKRKFMLANLLGVLIACTALIVICLMLDQGVVAEDSLVRKLFLKGVPAHE